MTKKINSIQLIKDVVLTSRPFSWINTAIPFFIGYLLSNPVFNFQIVIGAVYFGFSYNLLLYGINDIYDYESDLKNPRKNSIEGAVVTKEKHKNLWYAIATLNVPFLIYLIWTAPTPAKLWLILTILFCFTYSAKPFRFKEIPFLDSINSSLHFVAPLIFGFMYAGSANLPWPAIIAFLLWGMASQAFGSIQDIQPDRAAKIRSIATQFGAKFTTNYAMLCYSLTCLIVAITYFPWGLAAAGILSIYVLNVSFFKKYRSDAKSYEFRRGWKNFLWLNLIAGFWLVQIFLYVFDVWGSQRQFVVIVSVFFIMFAALQLGLSMYNYFVFKRPKTKRLSELPHISILMEASGEVVNLSSSLLALVGQNYPHFDVFIADTTNQDESREIVDGYQDKRLHFIDAELTDSDWHHSTAIAQLLLEQTNSELIVMLNGDTILLPNTLSMIASLFDQKKLDLASLLPADQNKSFWQQLVISQEHYFLMSLYPAAIMTKYFPKLVTAYSPLLTFNKSAINNIGGFKAVRKSPLESLDIANLAHQKGLNTAFYIASDMAVSQNRSSAGAILRQTSQRLYPSLRFNMPLTISLISGGIFVLLLPPLMLIVLVLSGTYYGTIILGIACLLLLLNRLVVMIRSKQSIISCLLYPIGSAVLLFSLANSMLYYELRKPRWQKRTEI